LTARASRRTAAPTTAERLRPGSPLGLVEETLRIERACCPFFELDLDPERRVMTVGVSSEEYVPALDAIAYSMSP
jgi:hypothetical protein